MSNDNDNVHLTFSSYQTEKEKVYSRQISAPILKRKSSRFGLGQFLSSGTNNSSHVATSQSLHSHHHQHLQINCAPQTHHLNPTSSSAGTTPTTPNLISAQQFQQQQNLGFNGINLGAPGRWSPVAWHFFSIGRIRKTFSGSFSNVELCELELQTCRLFLFRSIFMFSSYNFSCF